MGICEDLVDGVWLLNRSAERNQPQPRSRLMFIAVLADTRMSRNLNYAAETADSVALALSDANSKQRNFLKFN